MNSRWLYFYLLERKSKTNVWTVNSKNQGTLLGEIRWYSPWRQYCFYPINSIFNSEGLGEIKKFLDDETEKRRHDGA
ncbi:hypothetical protein LCGC14_1279120 [marine sediment metagenome]|uniref:Uncharacterized protein n=1 Tax=marine sediment metagenome TaxID=412755 RepID=A0A0F9KXJ1_9ZZZZ